MTKTNKKTGNEAETRENGENSRPVETLQAWMVTRLAEELKLAPAEINIRIPLVNYGLDSIVAFTLTGELADRLGRDLPATLFWDYPTIEILARHLVEKFNGVQSGVGVSTLEANIETSPTKRSIPARTES
jgi:acyl carrier protein